MGADSTVFQNEDKNRILRHFADVVDALADTAESGESTLRKGSPEAAALFERGQMAIALMSDEIARAIMEVHNSTEHDPQLLLSAHAEENHAGVSVMEILDLAIRRIGMVEDALSAREDQPEQPEIQRGVIERIAISLAIQELWEPSGDDESAERSLAELTSSIISIRTSYPAQFISPVDKISNKLFAGDFPERILHSVAMEKRGSRKELTTQIRIDFDGLTHSDALPEGIGINLYDREIHDAVVTLYVEGKNEYITPQMIYQVMTGDRKARLTERQERSVRESMKKCMVSRVQIEAREEAKQYGMDSLQYTGQLIAGETVTAVLNGTETECYRLLRSPILYDYASGKNQIGRADMRLLKTPVDKRAENIVLQGYIYRRILAMRGNPRLKRTILYETVMEMLCGCFPEIGNTRDKRFAVRRNILKMLDYWQQQEFISGYAEQKKGTQITCVTIQL